MAGRPNLTLPELSVLDPRARSTWALGLLLLASVLNALGVDLWALTRDLGLGASPQEVIASGERAVGAWQAVSPLLFGLWLWIERRAPSFRLVLWRRGRGAAPGVVPPTPR
jgi:hypothetical protein